MHSAATSALSGTTDVYLIVGHPVAQVQAPALFNAVFARAGLNAVMVPVQIAPGQVLEFVKAAFLAPNIRGLCATIPHKPVLAEWVDDCSPMGRIAGAVNAVRRHPDGRLEGALFDGQGLRAALDYFGMAYASRRVLVLGAGGAAAAIATELACAMPGAAAHVSLFDPVAGKAQVLAANSNDPAGFDLVINASPLGLQPDDALPCDVLRLEPHAAVMDIVMKHQPSPWVRAARARGLLAQPGFEMLIQQTVPYLEFFGQHTAAELVRADATFLREQIYPSTLRSEIRGREPHLLIPALL
jgi:shikimate dehydrogenase